MFNYFIDKSILNIVKKEVSEFIFNYYIGKNFVFTKRRFFMYFRRAGLKTPPAIFIGIHQRRIIY